jgi:hypothetical protein
VTKEQGKSFARWLKHPAKSDEGKMHLMRSEVMREVARKITREIRKQNAGGTARELAAQKPESTTDLNG